MGRAADPPVRRREPRARPRPLHRRSPDRPVGAVRAQPGGGGTHRPHHGAHRRERRDGRRARGRQADPADAAQVQIRAHRPADPGERRGPFRRRADRRGRRTQPGRRRGRCGSRRGRDRRNAGRGRRRGGPGIRRGPRARRGRRERGARRRDAHGRFRRRLFGCPHAHRRHGALAPTKRDAAGGARRPRGVRSDDRPPHPHLHDPDAAPDAHRRGGPDRDGGERRAGDRARCGRRLRPEDVAGAGIRSGRLARPPFAHERRLDRGPAREPRGRLSQPRSIHRAGRHVRRRGPIAGAVDRHRGQCRRLFVLPDHLRGRAADGARRDARALCGARLCGPRSRRPHPHLSDGALSRRLASGHHLRARTADGQGRSLLRARAGRDPAPQPDPDVSPHLGHRPRVRRGELCGDDGARRRGDRPAVVPRAPGEASTRGPLRRARHRRPSRSAPATARPPSRRAAWR